MLYETLTSKDQVGNVETGASRAGLTGISGPSVTFKKVLCSCAVSHIRRDLVENRKDTNLKDARQTTLLGHLAYNRTVNA